VDFGRACACIIADFALKSFALGRVLACGIESTGLAATSGGIASGNQGARMKRRIDFIRLGTDIARASAEGGKTKRVLSDKRGRGGKDKKKSPYKATLPLILKIRS